LLIILSSDYKTSFKPATLFFIQAVEIEGRLRAKLCELIEPSDVFLFKLVSKGILHRTEYDKLLCKETVNEKNNQLLTYLLDKSSVGYYTAVIEALKETDQQHVVNFIASKGGLFSQS
jgi:Caspase recruitment domain